MPARLVDRTAVADRTMAFSFELENALSFTPGQTVDITIPELLYHDDLGNSRTFSIASLPGDSRLMVATRIGGSAMKRTLVDAPLGLPVQVDGPYGSFTLHRNMAKPAVFFAGGIGITPFHSIIGDVTRRGERRAMTLFYTNRTARDVAWLPDLEAWAAQNPDFRLVATLSKPAPAEPWQHAAGRIDKAFLEPRLRDAANSIFYVAGPVGFVGAMLALLPECGADPDNIRSEEFAGY